MNTHPGRVFVRALSVLAIGLCGSLIMAPTASDAARSCARHTVSGGNQPVNPGRIDQRKLDAAITAEVNYLRCRKGLPKLAPKSSLRKISEGHSKWMATSRKLTHNSDRRGQQTPKQRVVSTGIDLRMGSENIAKVSLYRVDEVGNFRINDSSSCSFSTSGGQRIGRHTYTSLARYVADLWYRSSGHRKNMMDGRARMVGNGAGFDARARYCGDIYVTQSFAG